jgi:predicted ATP-binding protein involved in virulence
MRLKKFTGSLIHGFINPTVVFNKDISFLTGINGSGKTTVLNSIVALITPSLQVLADLDYELIKIEFENDGRGHFIQSSKSNDIILISCSNGDTSFSFSKHAVDSTVPRHRDAEREQEYYREILSLSKSNAVIQFISELPVPMFLGLDRRARLGEDDTINRYYANQVTSRFARNVFSASLTRSLTDAAVLAETQYRDALIAAGRVTQDLQREMLLKLLTLEPSSGFGPLTAPNRDDLKQMSAMRRDIEVMSHIFSLPVDQVRAKVVPFLDLLKGYADQLPQNANPDAILRKSKTEEGQFQALLNWSFNHPQLKRIKVISEMVLAYNEHRNTLTEPTTRYLKLINNFLSDSGKHIQHNDSGYISFAIDGVSGDRPINSLSSGEAQIFVILTHLAFNPVAQVANVFIIDEPELSLHVQWQELFVDSIVEANPNIQYILATHSPSIILEKTSKCIEVKARRRLSGNG